MSKAIAHFAFGAGMTTLLVTLLPRVRYPRTVILAGGGWAMLPDVHRLSPVAAGWMREFHRSAPLADFFWLHRTLDRLDPSDSEAVAAEFVTFFLVATAFSEWRGYRAPEPVRDTHGTSLDIGPAK